MSHQASSLIAAVVVIGLIGLGVWAAMRPSGSPAATSSPTAVASATTGAEPVITQYAHIVTAKGEIVIGLYGKDAPKTVANFVALTNKHYYDGLTFHRVEPGFVIQGGDPNGNGTGGVTADGKVLVDELNPDTPSYKLGYEKGVVAMANRGPNTGSSQFFIMLDDDPSLPHQYAIFGRVVQGQDVVDKIAVGDKMTKVMIKDK